MTYPMGT